MTSVQPDATHIVGAVGVATRPDDGAAIDPDDGAAIDPDDGAADVGNIGCHLFCFTL